MLSLCLELSSPCPEGHPVGVQLSLIAEAFPPPCSLLSPWSGVSALNRDAAAEADLFGTLALLSCFVLPWRVDAHSLVAIEVVSPS